MCVIPVEILPSESLRFPEMLLLTCEERWNYLIYRKF